MTKQDRIATLLAQGMPPSLVSTLVGVTPSYVSQLCKDQDFQHHIEALKTEQAEEAAESEAAAKLAERNFYIDRLAAAEHKVLDSVINNIAYMDPKTQLLALDTLGKRRDSMEAGMLRTGLVPTLNPSGGSVSVQVVQLTMPTICVPELQLSSNREILAIGGRSINPLPSSKLNELLAAQQAEAKGTTYDYDIPDL